MVSRLPIRYTVNSRSLKNYGEKRIRKIAGATEDPRQAEVGVPQNLEQGQLVDGPDKARLGNGGEEESLGEAVGWRVDV